jgi:hypothetical protein
MEIEAFRAEADAFDQRVQRIRTDQDAKQSALEADVEEGRQEFLNAVTPVLGRLMIETGGAVILERRDVFLSASLIDVTEEAIAAIDAQLGNGLTPPEPPPDERDTSTETEASPSEDLPEPAPVDPQRVPLAPAELDGGG